MMLTDQEFQLAADAALESLCSRLAEASNHHDFDVDMNNSTLTVEFEEPPQRFVVSPNSAVHQIWVSAHVQSFKLDWTPARSAFVLAASGQTLEELIVAAIARVIPGFSL